MPVKKKKVKKPNPRYLRDRDKEILKHTVIVACRETDARRACKRHRLCDDCIINLAIKIVNR